MYNIYKILPIFSIFLVYNSKKYSVNAIFVRTILIFLTSIQNLLDVKQIYIYNKHSLQIAKPNSNQLFLICHFNIIFLPDSQFENRLCSETV